MKKRIVTIMERSETLNEIKVSTIPLKLGYAPKYETLVFIGNSAGVEFREQSGRYYGRRGDERQESLHLEAIRDLKQNGFVPKRTKIYFN